MCEGETSGCPFTYFNDRTSNFFLKFDVRFSLSKRLTVKSKPGVPKAQKISPQKDNGSIF